MTHKEFLFYIIDVLEKNKIPYFLFCGTLLGAIRNKDFLPSDSKDTDIAVDDKYYWEIRYLFNREILKNNKFEYYFIWRKEISIINNTKDIKIDIFFMERNNEKYSMYSYKPNPETHRWDYEWKTDFTYKYFYPLNTIIFLGKKISIPNNYKKILQEQYGKWKTPQPQWVSSDKTLLNVDTSYQGFFPAGISSDLYKIDNSQYDIGFITVNLIRTESTKACIESIKNNYPNVKIYVGDQDAPSGNMIEFYEKNNIEYYYLPYDCGLGYARNFLIEKVKEPFLIWGDNDFIFNNQSNIAHGQMILNNYKHIGVVGGSVITNDKLQHYERILSYLPDYNILVYIPLELTNPTKHSIDNIDFYYCDLTFNYVICKTEILKNNLALRWNEKLKVAYEHTSMFLCIQQFNTFKVVYCPSMQVIHQHSFKHTTYNELRNRKNASRIFGDIWNLKLNFTIGQGREIYNESFTSEKDLAKKVYLIESPVEKDIIFEKQTSDIKGISAIKNSSHTDILMNFLIELNKNEDFWFLNRSCLEIINHRRILSNKLYIGVKNEETHNKINKILSESNLNITWSIDIEPYRKTKLFNDFKVPVPVIAYLENQFNKKWDELKNE